MSNDPELPGLRRRTLIDLGKGRVAVSELWDMSQPGCPLVWNGGTPLPAEHSVFVNYVVSKDDAKLVRVVEP